MFKEEDNMKKIMITAVGMIMVISSAKAYHGSHGHAHHSYHHSNIHHGSGYPHHGIGPRHSYYHPYYGPRYNDYWQHRRYSPYYHNYPYVDQNNYGLGYQSEPIFVPQSMSPVIQPSQGINVDRASYYENPRYRQHIIDMEKQGHHIKDWY